MHEYQSKELMNAFGVNTQRFVLAENAGDAANVTSDLKWSEYVVKAQILAGGRGKGTFSSGLRGGVKLTRNTEDIGPLVEQMVGHRLVTHQTGREGVLVRKVMIAEAKDLKKETYFAIVLDRAAGGPVLVASAQGGVDIEAVAKDHPDAILTLPVASFEEGPSVEQLGQLVSFLGLTETPEIAQQAKDQICRLYQLFRKVDATQVEINPFGLTPEGEVLCFDAKINFDDNAAFRQAAVFAQADTAEMDPRELEAAKLSLNYIGMEGSIGCLVNGAGLAMATMDILHLHGGAPANFLDVGGSANVDQIAAAYQLLLQDTRVRSIFVNIFGGIMRCDLIAEGILKAVAATPSSVVPLVIRLAGTNAEMAKERLQSEYPKEVFFCDDLDLAAANAVRLTQSSPKAPARSETEEIKAEERVFLAN